MHKSNNNSWMILSMNSNLPPVLLAPFGSHPSCQHTTQVEPLHPQSFYHTHRKTTHHGWSHLDKSANLHDGHLEAEFLLFLFNIHTKLTLYYKRLINCCNTIVVLELTHKCTLPGSKPGPSQTYYLVLTGLSFSWPKWVNTHQQTSHFHCAQRSHYFSFITDSQKKNPE